MSAQVPRSFSPWSFSFVALGSAALVIAISINEARAEDSAVAVRQAASTRCVDGASARARLSQLLRRNSDGGSIRVVVTAAPSMSQTTRLRLRVMRARDGKQLLRREYALSPTDCRSSVDLLALALERFLGSFALDRIRARRRAKRRVLTVALHAAVVSSIAPLGAGAELGGDVDYGGDRHRFGAGLSVRAGLPRSLESGRYQQTALLGALLWRWVRYRWQPRVGARAGAARITGWGFDRPRSSWVPWIEGTLGVDRRWTRIAVGLHLALSPLSYRAETEDGTNSSRLPLLRLGLRVSIPLWIKKK